MSKGRRQILDKKQLIVSIISFVVAGFLLLFTPDSALSQPQCGNAILEGVEVCDDGNLTDGDGCSSTCEIEDLDGDEVPDDQDLCFDTFIPEGVPTVGLGKNRFALVDSDTTFDTNSPKGKGPRKSFTLEDTSGCSCEQIIEIQGLGKGHSKFGCSIGEMEDWALLVPEVCPLGYDDCDEDTGNGCETNLSSDVLNCGACGSTCPDAGFNQVTECVSGSCSISCQTGFSDCDGDPVNGCEFSGVCF